MDTTNDAIRPSHYAFDEGVIECIDYIDSHAFDFVEGNIIKYVTRYQHKNGTEDLKKAEEWDNKWAKRNQFTYDDLLEDEEFQRRTGEELDAQSGPANQS